MSARIKIPVQIDVTTDNQWEKLLENKELIVVDVYAGWCGPCTSMKSTLRRIKFTVGEDVRFATANSDNISHLQQFQNKSEPTWLFIVEKNVVNVMYGCNSQELLKMISKELKKEILIQQGEMARINLDMTEMQKETPLIKPPPEKPVEVVEKKFNPLLSDEDFPYRPFAITYE